jgi:hypothetical protein
MDRDYAVGIIMDIGNDIIIPVKEELLKFIKGLRYGDRVYVYHPDNDRVPKKLGESVSKMLNYGDYHVCMEDALKQTVAALREEDDEYEKVIFVVTSKLKSEETFGHKKGVASDRDKEMKFVFLCLKETYDELQLDITKEKVDIESLEEIMAGVLDGEEERATDS